MNNFFFVALNPFVYIIDKKKLINENGVYRYEVSSEITLYFAQIEDSSALCLDILKYNKICYISNYYLGNVAIYGKRMYFDDTDSKENIRDLDKTNNFVIDGIIRNALDEASIYKLNNMGISFEEYGEDSYQMYLYSLKRPFDAEDPQKLQLVFRQ